MSFFDIVAPIYDQILFKTKNDFLNLYKIARFKAEDKVLDLGGGTGRLAKFIKYYVNEVIVADPSENMIKQCQKTQGIQCVLTQAEQLPFSDHYFDKIILVDAFHHLKNQALAVKEIARVLKKNGLIVVVEFNPRKILVKLLEITEKILIMKSKFYTPELLEQFFQKHEFKTKLINQDKKVYYLVGKK